MNDVGLGVIMGLVEGITEFLPVSSTGHMIVAGHLLDFSGTRAASFEVFIQLGAILAVVFVYLDRFTGLVPSPGQWHLRGTDFSGVRGIALLGLTTFPALVAGFLTHAAIKEYLFSPKTVALALGVGGAAILLVERYRPEPRVDHLDGLTYAQALLIGCFECLALWPGMSRSASTIVGGLLTGLDRKTAAEYSFLAAVPVMVAAAAYDLLKSWSYLERSDIVLFAVGFGVSFVSAAIAVKSFIALVQRWSLAPYAYYRLAVAPLIYFILS